ncbi:SDR family oxidoreductase [Kribbella sp. NBC_01505]|uniref:SDR family oxidoreductase n=1 Tax=Kribbella sp. NBC_01505 TaxID=2903580 RepID=UPI003866016F
MRVFVTGATGFVGSAVVTDLIDAGHQVVGLARSADGAAAVAAAGAEVQRGSLADLEVLQTAAATADAVIHTAFVHDFANWAGAVATDQAAITAIGDALAGSDRPFVVTSATGLVRGDGIALESSPANPDVPTALRFGSEGIALAYADQGVRVSVLRLSPSVHGEGDPNFIAGLIATARQHGTSAYVADGANCWAAVHRSDAARLYRAALNAPAGSRLHAVGEEAVPFREIAEVIGRQLAVPVVSITPDQAPDHFGWLAGFAVHDVRASSQATQQLLNWHPTGPGLIPDLEKGHYFTSGSAGS